MFASWRIASNGGFQAAASVCRGEIKRAAGDISVCLFLQYVHDAAVDNSGFSTATVAGHMTSTFPLLHSVSVVDP